MPSFRSRKWAAGSRAPARGAPSCPEPCPWLTEVRCAAPCPPIHQGSWGKVRGAEAEVREHRLRKTALKLLETPSGTPFPVPVCIAEQVCRAGALHCALPVPSDASSPQGGGWLRRGAQRTAKFPPSGTGTLVSTYCVPGGVPPPPPPRLR